MNLVFVCFACIPPLLPPHNSTVNIACSNHMYRSRPQHCFFLFHRYGKSFHNQSLNGTRPFEKNTCRYFHTHTHTYDTHTHHFSYLQFAAPCVHTIFLVITPTSDFPFTFDFHIILTFFKSILPPCTTVFSIRKLVNDLHKMCAKS